MAPAAPPLVDGESMNDAAIDAFVERLAHAPAGPTSTNMFDHSDPANAVRRRNLARYLEQLAERRPSTLLVGEAPGYRGMRITGVPFTNTAILARGIRELDLLGTANGYALPDPLPTVAAEPTATVMWTTLVELDFVPALWSAFPLHPHRSGAPLTNRKPTAAETSAWAWSWQELERILSIEAVVAVGNVAAEAVARAGRSVPRVRHPAHGGRVQFARGLHELLDDGVIR
jgi:uracil-DNA glycosylase